MAAVQTEFPRNASAFKIWADRECAAWPECLTAASYWAWCALAGTVSNTEYIDDFATAYAEFRNRE